MTALPASAMRSTESLSREDLVGDVIQLARPIDEARLLAALREITDSETTAIVIIAATSSTISVRAFGANSAAVAIEAVRALADAQHAKCD